MGLGERRSSGPSTARRATSAGGQDRRVAALGQHIEGVGRGAAAHGRRGLLGGVGRRRPTTRDIPCGRRPRPSLPAARPWPHGRAAPGRWRPEAPARRPSAPRSGSRWRRRQPGVGLAVAHPPEAEGRRPASGGPAASGQRPFSAAELRFTFGSSADLRPRTAGIGGRDRLLGAAVGIARQGHGDGAGVEAAEGRVADLQGHVPCRQARQQCRRGGIGPLRPAGSS